MTGVVTWTLSERNFSKIQWIFETSNGEEFLPHCLFIDVYEDLSQFTGRRDYLIPEKKRGKDRGREDPKITIG